MEFFIYARGQTQTGDKPLSRPRAGALAFFMFKKTSLLYDKIFEEEQRESFWKSRHKYLYPNRSVVSLEKLAEIEGRDESKAISDRGQFQKELMSQLEFEILINDLPSKEKEAVRLRANGFKREEIAKEMNIKPNAVKQLIYRGFLKIKKKFGKFYGRKGKSNL